MLEFKEKGRFPTEIVIVNRREWDEKLSEWKRGWRQGPWSMIHKELFDAEDV